MEMYIEGAEGEVSPRREWCVVYDADSLRILHIQRITTIGEPQAADKGQLEALALENASRYFEGQRLAVMHPEVTDVDPSSVDAIDPETMTLKLVDGTVHHPHTASD
jgi:hypothetical protein